MKVLILYYSKTGHTLEAATAIAAGIKEEKAEVEIVNIASFNESLLKQYDSIIVGSPCWAGVVSKNGVAKPVQNILKALPENCLKGKIAGGFSVQAVSGGTSTVTTIGKQLIKKGCIKYKAGPIAKAGSVLSITKGPSVSKQDLEIYKTYGREFVK